VYQRRPKDLAIFLRGELDTAAIPEQVRGQVQSVDSQLPVFGARTLEDVLADSLSDLTLQHRPNYSALNVSLTTTASAQMPIHRLDGENRTLTFQKRLAHAIACRLWALKIRPSSSAARHPSA
jgi:hypothetical protein